MGISMMNLAVMVVVFQFAESINFELSISDGVTGQKPVAYGGGEWRIVASINAALVVIVTAFDLNRRMFKFSLVDSNGDDVRSAAIIDCSALEICSKSWYLPKVSKDLEEYSIVVSDRSGTPLLRQKLWIAVSSHSFTLADNVYSGITSEVTESLLSTEANFTSHKTPSAGLKKRGEVYMIAGIITPILCLVLAGAIVHVCYRHRNTIRAKLTRTYRHPMQVPNQDSLEQGQVGESSAVAINREIRVLKTAAASTKLVQSDHGQAICVTKHALRQHNDELQELRVITKENAGICRALVNKDIKQVDDGGTMANSVVGVQDTHQHEREMPL